jgi:hypothetical protein
MVVVEVEEAMAEESKTIPLLSLLLNQLLE